MKTLFRSLPVFLAFGLAVCGAAGVQISMIASAGLYGIVTGPLYLAVCGAAILAAFLFSFRSQLAYAGEFAWIVVYAVMTLLVASWLGVLLGSFINRTFLHWYVSYRPFP